MRAENNTVNLSRNRNLGNTLRISQPESRVEVEEERR